MDKRRYSYLVIIFIIKSSEATSCSIRNDYNCYYTVNCDIPAKIKIVSYCGYSDLYITLVINGSPVHNVTANFFNAKFDVNVRILTAIGNSWDAVQNYAFSNFKNVVYMDLSENQIKSIGKAFIGLEQLDSLNLSRNHLEVIKPSVFMFCDRNNRLYLLDLSYNSLTYLPDDLFVNMYKLRQLYLQGNKLTMLGDQYSANLKNLNFLNLCCNNFTTLNKTLKHFTNLKELDLSFNQFKNIDVFEVESLETINLSHNIFEEVMLDNFAQFAYLERLDLSYNKLKKILSSNNSQHPNKGTKPLIKIFLNNNDITHINETFFINFNYIQLLNLSYNKIREIAKGTFKHVKILKVLSVSNCRLKLTNETFLDLKHTKIIDISGNNINSLNATFFSKCIELKTIEADFNNITTVDTELFQKLVPSLTRIALRGNPIALMTTLDPTETVTTIETIQISTLLQKALDSVDFIKELYYIILIILFLLLGTVLLLIYVPKCASKNRLHNTLKVKNV